jgi:hypothetical protein
MWKKVLVLSLIVLSVVALATGVMASVNAADTVTPDKARLAPPPGGRPGGPGGPGGPELMTRVAQILKIDKQNLEDAFKQAGSELAQKNMDNLFAGWIKDGKLTQAQADQYKAWLKAKPADMPGFGFGSGDPARDNEMMSNLLKDGKIKQAQYDAWKAWIAQKPTFDLPKPERPAGAPPHNKPTNTK